MGDGARFDGRVALVTGGTRGIGRGIAERLVAEGAEVAVCGRKEPDELPAGLAFFPADVREGDQVEALIDAVVARFGRLDVAVNNAGGAPTVDAATAPAKLTEKIVALNLTAALLVSEAANRAMQGQDSGGAIVDVTSVSALRPSPGAAAYGAAKAGVVNLARSQAQAWAPKVRVNCVSAGLIETEQTEEWYGGPEGVARVAAVVPLGRMGTPADVAEAVCFLGSPAAAYITGANLVLDGGGEVASNDND
jgi:NAD(P)-dependent dehydrogenase (short-subunit alcohol dehydrogenase family)